MKIEFILTEKKLRHHFLHFKYEKNFRAHGQMIRSDPKSNSFERLGLSSLHPSLAKIQLKVTEKSWSIINCYHRSRACNSQVTGQIQPQSKLFLDCMPVLVTCKFDEDWVHSNIEKMATPFSHSKSMGTLKGEELRGEKSDSAQIQTRPTFNVCPRYLQVLQRFD